MRKLQGYLVLFIVVFGPLACRRESFQDFYSGLGGKVYFSQGSSGAGQTLASSGSLKISENNFSYALSLDRVYTMKDLNGLDPAVKRLVLKKAILRKMALQQGLDEKIFDTEDANRYLLPRLEKIMEDYYYFRKGDFEGIQRETSRLDPGEAVMRKFYEEDKTVKKSGIKMKSLVDQKDAILRVLARKRMEDARLKATKELLDANPPIEVK